jgi:hypothetical protein
VTTSPGPRALYRSPLRDVLPVTPTARVIEEGFHPLVSELGARHPVTEGLEAHAPRRRRWTARRAGAAGSASPRSRRPCRPDGDGGARARPLLVLDRVGEGRIAMLASDHAWLWSRGYEGGGPQLELLRRLAHWMMGEPELEEEALTATPAAAQVTVTRRTLAEDGAAA